MSHATFLNETRVKTLSFGHHKLIAGLPQEQQIKFLSERWQSRSSDRW